MASLGPSAEPFHVMPTAQDARPRLALRVGISGHRSLASADPRRLDEVLGELLDTIAATVQTIHDDPDAQILYAPAPPLFLFVSPLAEGADRLAAKAALARGWRLATPMPFAQASYERDFPDSVDEFRTMLKRAEADAAVVELDGSYDEAKRPEAYFEAGRFVLRHCDILIAIWDRQPASGVGGTGDVVQKALDWSIPVIHIGSAAPHAVTILTEGAREEPISPEDIAGLVAQQVRTVLSPGLDAQAKEAARRYFLHEAAFPSNAERNYYDRGPFVATPALPFPGARRVFKFVMSLAGGPFPVNEPAPSTPPTMPANAQFFFDHFQRADCLALAYSEIHRGAFVLIYFFGAWALVAGFAALAFHATPFGVPLVCVEFVLLWWVFILYTLDRRWKTRERWLDYRLLAEMLREADLLALVGRSLAYRAIAEHEEDLAPRARWASQAFRAISRAAGVTGGRYDDKHLEKVKKFAAEGRLTDQIRYHDKNGERTRALNFRLRIVSIAFFCITLGAVSMKLVLLHPPGHETDFGSVLALTAGGFTALAYGLFGMRNQAEFEIVGRRSERMKTKLRRHRRKLRDIRDAGLTSVALGREMVRASEAMRHDVADWIGIFEMKETETG